MQLLSNQATARRRKTDPDGVHNILPQNMAAWRIEYFNLEEFEKRAAARKVSHSFALKQVIKSLCESVLPLPRGKEHPCLQRKVMPRQILTSRPC